MTPNEQQLKNAIEHISFEMNRYLYTANPIFPLPGRYGEAVAESCLSHSRAIGEFFFEEINYDDIRISHYFDKLISKDELENEIEKSRSDWDKYKKRTNKKLCHLTFRRVDSFPMDMEEKEAVNFDKLIELFKINLPADYREKWEKGKSFSI
jgi:hypothetical protein